MLIINPSQSANTQRRIHHAILEIAAEDQDKFVPVNFMKTYRVVVVQIDSFITSVLDGAEIRAVLAYYTT